MNSNVGIVPFFKRGDIGGPLLSRSASAAHRNRHTTKKPRRSQLRGAFFVGSGRHRRPPAAHPPHRSTSPQCLPQATFRTVRPIPKSLRNFLPTVRPPAKKGSPPHGSDPRLLAEPTAGSGPSSVRYLFPTAAGFTSILSESFLSESTGAGAT